MRFPGHTRNEQPNADPAAVGILSVMMPIYNEDATLEIILSHVLARPEVGEVIAVNNGSTDRSAEILARIAARDERIRVITLSQNRGKGGALRCAIAEVSRPYAIVQDADLEYDPCDYPRLLEPLLDGRADVAYGSRFAGGAHSVQYYWHAVANHLVTTLSNMLTNLNLSDVETCYKVVRTDLLRSLRLRGSGFEIDPELTVKLAKARARFFEIPISYSGRTYEEGKKLGWPDAIHAILALIRFRLID